MTFTILAAVTGIVALYVFLRAFLHFTQDPREPPLVTGTIPFISPLMGMIIEKADYYVRMRDQYHLPIYTLRALGPRLYVVNSLRLVKRIDKVINTVAFSPIELRAADKAMGVSKDGIDKMGGDHLLKGKGYMMSFPRAMAPAAAPGPGLDALSRTVVNTIAASFDLLAAQEQSTVNLFDWVRHEIFMGMTEATYGPHNPFREGQYEKAWYTYESGIMTLLIDFLPSVFARASLKARDSMATQLRNYFQEEKHLEGSLLVQLRRKHNLNFGVSSDDIVLVEIGQIAASVGNTVPSAFWTIWQIFANPVVFEDCRREVLQLVQRGKDGTCTIDLAKVKAACPILVSTWQEVLRFHGISISARVVQEDTWIDNRYLLKKGGLVMMPLAVVHSDESLWGPTARQFNHNRFLHCDETSDGFRRAPAAAFRGFGGGPVMCPGRHFASAEVLSLAALLLVRFDVRPIGGKWVEPRKNSVMNAAFPKPKDKVMVEIIPRSKEKWHVVFSDNAKGVNLTVDDLGTANGEVDTGDKHDNS